MGYYNMIYARGLDKFAEDCAKSGITGMIVPDLPPEEAAPLKEACNRYGVDLIFLAAPNTPPARLKMIEEETSGFLYLVARTGVTGARSDVLQDTRDLIARVPGKKPKAVGFGISTPEQAAEVIRAGADAAIVGSVCVDLIARGEIEELEQTGPGDERGGKGGSEGKAPIVGERISRLCRKGRGDLWKRRARISKPAAMPPLWPLGTPSPPASR